MIPDDVYKLNDPELLQNLVGSDDDLKWWETEPIAKLYLCSNKIRLEVFSNRALSKIIAQLLSNNDDSIKLIYLSYVYSFKCHNR